MEKQLSVSGTAKLSRKEIVAIIAEHLKTEHGLVVEKAVPLSKGGRPAAFNSMVFYVYDITEKDTKRQRKRFSRPNYGIGKKLREVLSDGKEHKMDEIYNKLKPEFPKLKKAELKKYLGRPEIAGAVVGDNNTYLQLQA